MKAKDFGAPPELWNENVAHSPEESATDWWWTGWVSKKEYCEYKEKEEGK